jgi:hypothetical protein
MLSPDKVDDPVSSLEDDDDQDADFMDVEEINSELVPCLVMRAARQRRDELIEALVKGYGSTSALFVQMYICCADIRDLTFNRKMDLEERIDELEAEIEESSDASQIAEWQNEVHELRQQMEPDALRSAVLAGIMDEAFGPVDFLYDMDSPRWLGFHWFDQGCQVMLFGTPEVS